MAMGLIYGGLYAAGLLRAIGNYEPIMPVICQVVVYLFGTIAMLAQLIAALLLFARSPQVVRATSPSIVSLVLVFGVACVGAMPFGDWSIVTFVGFSAVWPIILHFASERASRHSGLSFVECSGYVLAGALMTLIGIGFALASMFDSSPSNASPPDVSLSEEPTPVVELEAATEQPDDILNRLTGHWDIVAEQNGEATVVAKAIASKLEETPWVVRQMFDLKGVLHGIQVTGFDADRSQYHYYRVGVGSASSHFAGTWDAENRSFTWVQQLPDDDSEIIRERIGDALIEATHEIVEDGLVQRSSTFELRRTRSPRQYTRGPAFYKQYEGAWSMTTKTTVGEDSIVLEGRAIFARLPDTALLASLYFNNHSGNLADIQLTYFDGNEKPLRRRWITNPGQPVELKGTPSRDKGKIVWSGSVEEDTVLTITETFIGDDRFVRSLRVESITGEVLMNAQTELHQVEP